MYEEAGATPSTYSTIAQRVDIFESGLQSVQLTPTCMLFKELVPVGVHAMPVVGSVSIGFIQRVGCLPPGIATRVLVQ